MSEAKMRAAPILRLIALLSSFSTAKRKYQLKAVWSANVYEQIDQIVWNYDLAAEDGADPIIHFARRARPFDTVHDIVAGYGRLLFPWRGRWLMVTDKWRLRWTDRRGFHNCSATGIR